MTYKASPGPKVVVGIIACIVVGLFLLVMAQAVVPYFYEQYQKGKLADCEERHPVAKDAWQPIFGFDMGGRVLAGDSPEDRALIDCIVASQSPRYADKRLFSDHDETLPAVSYSYSAFRPGLHFEYYPGQGATQQND